MATRFLDVPGGRLAYDATGSGPLVVCVPSMGDLRGEYRFLAPLVAAAGYRVVTLDVRGHGETSTGWSDYTVAGVGLDIVALIRALDAGRAVIVGTSMAAGAAVWAAAEAPELIAGLVLIGAFVRGEGGAAQRLMFHALFARPWGPALWLRYFKTLYPSRKPADFAAYCAALQTNLKQPGRMEALMQMMLASKRASAERLGRVAAPATVIMGSKDPDFKAPQDEGQWIAEQLHGPLHLIEGAGHYPHAEMPDVTSPLILAFLKSLK